MPVQTNFTNILPFASTFQVNGFTINGGSNGFSSEKPEEIEFISFGEEDIVEEVVETAVEVTPEIVKDFTIVEEAHEEKTSPLEKNVEAEKGRDSFQGNCPASSITQEIVNGTEAVDRSAAVVDLCSSPQPLVITMPAQQSSQNGAPNKVLPLKAQKLPIPPPIHRPPLPAGRKKACNVPVTSTPRRRAPRPLPPPKPAPFRPPIPRPIVGRPLPPPIPPSLNCNFKRPAGICRLDDSRQVDDKPPAKKLPPLPPSVSVQIIKKEQPRPFTAERLAQTNREITVIKTQGPLSAGDGFSVPLFDTSDPAVVSHLRSLGIRYVIPVHNALRGRVEANNEMFLGEIQDLSRL